MLAQELYAKLPDLYSMTTRREARQKKPKKKSDRRGVSTVDIDYATAELPFETKALRESLRAFLNSEVVHPLVGTAKKVGSFKWGIYSFFDYEHEPIYVGQTNEKLSTRIRRHLTNQRTDAVAMKVLDPFEVCYVRVWPLPEYEKVKADDVDAKKHLDALEYAIYQQLLGESKFNAVLNEKSPPPPLRTALIPEWSYEQRIVSVNVSKLRDHPDLRIARRALTLSRLAQVIAERRVSSGLRRTLLTQAERLRWLAEQRFKSAGDQGETDED